MVLMIAVIKLYMYMCAGRGGWGRDIHTYLCECWFITHCGVSLIAHHSH